MLIPGLLFGMLAGYTFWFPKAFGFRLDERWGYRRGRRWIVGFMLAFFPLYALGLMGMPRRTVGLRRAGLPALHDRRAASAALLILFALCRAWSCSSGSASATARTRRVPVGDPWDGRSLEWATPAPPPEWNFAVTPEVDDRDAFMTAKESGRGLSGARSDYEDIELPRNSALGLVLCLGGAGLRLRAGLVHLVAGVAGAAMRAALPMIARGFVRDTHRSIGCRRDPERTRRAGSRAARAAPPSRATQEQTPANRGRACPPRRRARHERADSHPGLNLGDAPRRDARRRPRGWSSASGSS